jgi:hypothetical protein
VYTIFVLFHPPTPSPHILSLLTGTTPPQTGPVPPSCSVFVKNKVYFCLINYTGSFLVTFPCICVL